MTLSLMTSRSDLHGSKRPPLSFFWRHQEEVTKLLSAGCHTSEQNHFLRDISFSHYSQVLYGTARVMSGTLASKQKRLFHHLQAITPGSEWSFGLEPETLPAQSPEGTLITSVVTSAVVLMAEHLFRQQISEFHQNTHIWLAAKGVMDLKSKRYFLFFNVFSSIYFLTYAAARTLKCVPYSGLMKTYSILFPTPACLCPGLFYSSPTDPTWSVLFGRSCAKFLQFPQLSKMIQHKRERSAAPASQRDRH